LCLLAQGNYQADDAAVATVAPAAPCTTFITSVVGALRTGLGAPAVATAALYVAHSVGA
jgi:hypothetical protein